MGPLPSWPILRQRPRPDKQERRPTATARRRSAFYELTKLLADAAHRSGDAMKERALLESGFEMSVLPRWRTYFAAVLARVGPLVRFTRFNPKAATPPPPRALRTWTTCAASGARPEPCPSTPPQWTSRSIGTVSPQRTSHLFGGPLFIPVWRACRGARPVPRERTSSRPKKG